MASSPSMLRSALIVLASVLAGRPRLAHAHHKQSPAANAEVAALLRHLTLNF